VSWSTVTRFIVYHMNFVYKISTRHFLTELENNDSRRLLWHCLISSSLNENSTSQLNFVVFLEDFQRNHEQRFWHWSTLFLHVSPLQPDILSEPQVVFILHLTTSWVYPMNKLLPRKTFVHAFPQHFTNQFEDAIFDARYCQCNSPKFNLFHQRE